jgi:hypothetical protein
MSLRHSCASRRHYREFPRHSREGANLYASDHEIPAFAGMTGGAGIAAEGLA